MAISIQKIFETDNVAELLDETQLGTIGQDCLDGYIRDKNSRSDWEGKIDQALKLALQVMEEKTTPWPKASNVKFPLITIASMQFSARAYPALLPASDVVKVKVCGEQTQETQDRAARISKHMSYQVLEEDEDWEEEFDRLLLAVPIIGCSFKKSYFDPLKGHNRSVHVLAPDLVVDYWAKSLEAAERKTHRYYLRDREVTERKRAGRYLDIELGQAQQHPDKQKQTKDDAQGTTPDTREIPREILEQHTYLDLDGDGYPEPYIVTLDHSSAKVLRITKRFEVDDVELVNDKIAKIPATEFFTKYGFIPSPDGGFYDIGFGLLLGSSGHAIDTLINQLVDAGTLSNRQSGFLGRGIKIKRGNNWFKPGEWKSMSNTGEDLSKNIVPLPVREPSQVLFQLLGLLIEYAERVTSVSDMMPGVSPGQNQPATTSMAVLEQGMKVFSGIFKRMHRSMRDEFRKLYRLNQIYLNPDSEFYYEDAMMTGFRADYRNPYEIKPASDPTMATDTQKMLQAEALVTRAATTPGYNIYQVEKNYLEAMKVEDIERVFPNPTGPNAIPEKPSLDMLKLQVEQDKAKSKAMVDLARLVIEAAHAEADITRLEADAVRLIADAESKEVGQQLDLYRSQIENMKARRESLLELIEAINEGSGIPGVAAQPGDEAGLAVA